VIPTPRGWLASCHRLTVANEHGVRLVFPSLVGRSLAAKVILGVAGMSAAGVGVAAEAGSLPTPEPSGSPEVESNPSGSADGRGPVATGPAAKGLCQAYTSGRKAGRSLDSTAFRALATAAGTGSVDAYCARVLATPTPDASGHGGSGGEHGKPPTGSDGGPGKGGGSDH
jgi:hypothetical protein